MALRSLGSGRLNSPNSKGGSGKLCAVLLALSLTLVTLSSREAGTGPLSSVRSVFTVITTPFEYAGMLMTRPFLGLANIVHNLTADTATLSELEEENEALRLRIAELEESEILVNSLQDLLDLQSTYDLESTAATVISGSTDSWTATLTIAKGSAAGLEVGMPVCSGSGVIGQIIECGTSSSVVRLLTDEDSAIPAVVQSSRALGTLTGSADGSLSMEMVTTDNDVEVGDIIVTSGLGGIYPKGLPLGTVTNVEYPEGAVYYEISVEPIVNIDALEEVLVITSITDSQQATESEYSSDSESDSESTSTTSDSATSSQVATTQESDSSEDESSDDDTASA